MRRYLFSLLLLCCCTAEAGIRDHTRPDYPRDTPVSEAQGQVLSLTLAEVGQQQIQQWVRTAGEVDGSGSRLLARDCFTDAALVKPGQRVISFPPDAKSSITQAWVSRVEVQQGCSVIEANLTGSGHPPGQLYVMEIIVVRGRFLALPNEAIIETGTGPLVYLHHHGGHYVPRPVHLGLRGERYSQLLHGLTAGEQVVTLGSFFIHAQQLLGEQSSAGGSHAHHAH